MDLWECALGFMDSQVLLTAEEIGVFESMAQGPRGRAEIARHTNLSEASAQRLLTALCAMQIIKKLPDGRFENGPEAAEQLVRSRPGYIGAMFHHVKTALYPLWNHFREALMEGTPQWQRAFGGSAPGEDMYSDREALYKFMRGMHEITYKAAAEFAASAAEIGNIKTIVDVGGASGAFLIALAKQNPALEGTVFDLPQVKPIAEQFIQNEKLQGRLRFHSGSFWDDEIPHGADAYSLGFILHDWADSGGSFILKKIADAAKPGSFLIIGEYLLNKNRTGPLAVARSDLNMLVAAHGRERTAEEYCEWVQGFGFGLQRIYHACNYKSFLVMRLST